MEQDQENCLNSWLMHRLATEMGRNSKQPTNGRLNPTSHAATGLSVPKNQRPGGGAWRRRLSSCNALPISLFMHCPWTDLGCMNSNS